MGKRVAKEQINRDDLDSQESQDAKNGNKFEEFLGEKAELQDKSQIE